MPSKNTLKAMGLGGFITASALVGAPLTMKAEGMKLVPYYDSVGVKTWCVGETEVGYKEKFETKDCDFLYTIRYGYYSMRLSEAYTDKGKSIITPEMHAAFTDLAYNVGIDGVKNSSVARALNAGDAKLACDNTLKFKFAGGKDCSLPGNRSCPGVWTRRLLMHKLCTKGMGNALASSDRA